MTPTVTLEPFEMGDYTAVVALWRQCEGVGLSSADAPDAIARYLARNPGMSFVARSAGRIVGAILGGHDGRRGLIHHLAVHPDYRRQGVGAQLTARGLEALRAAGIQKCHLFIFHANATGRAFWEDQGWTWREDIQVMSRTLD
jgi:N-acetylglutamate synthase